MTHNAASSEDHIDSGKFDVDNLQEDHQRPSGGRANESTDLVDTLMHSHKLRRSLLHALIPNPHEILRLTSIVEFLGRNEMSEFILRIDHLILDVERSKENVDTHVVRSKSEFELESFEDGVGE